MFQLIKVNGEKYMLRIMLTPHIFGYQLLFHWFFQGDTARAVHDHPFKFWTFPLRGYWELVPAAHHGLEHHYVKPWRWHFRNPAYRHRVVSAYCVPTIVLRGPHHREWYFYEYSPDTDTDTFGDSVITRTHWTEYDV